VFPVAGHVEGLLGQHQLKGGGDDGERLSGRLVDELVDVDGDRLVGADQCVVEGDLFGQVGIVQPDPFGEMPLRIKIDQQYPLSEVGECSTQVDGQGGLAHSTLLITNSDNMRDS
jgi:hypothetical protein